MKGFLVIWAIFLSVFSFAQADDTTQTGLLNDNRFQIRNIILTGNEKTHQKVILRELSVQEGSSFRADSLDALLEQNRLRLATIGLFTDIQLQADTIALRMVDLHISVRERWYIIPELAFQLADRNFNVWWTEQNRDLRRVIIGLTLRNKNFRGRLENLSVTTQAGYTQKVYIDYFKPYIDKAQKHGLGFSLGVAASQETFYTTDSNKLRFVRLRDDFVLWQYEGYLAYSYRPAYASRHLVRLGYREFRVGDTVLNLNPEFYNQGSKDLRLLELTYRYELNKTDNWNYPLKGTKLITHLVGRAGIKGIDKQVFGTLELGQYNHLGGKWYTSATFRGRVTLTEDQPYAFRYALGTKYEYVRGYEYYVIDGTHFGVLRANLKHEILNITIRNIPFKYLPVLPLRVYPKVFGDVGYVSNPVPGNSFLNNKTLYTAGLGVDVFTAYDIKLRFEYGWNHLGQKGLFLHFTSE